MTQKCNFNINNHTGILAKDSNEHLHVCPMGCTLEDVMPAVELFGVSDEQVFVHLDQARQNGGGTLRALLHLLNRGIKVTIVTRYPGAVPNILEGVAIMTHFPWMGSDDFDDPDIVSVGIA